MEGNRSWMSSAEGAASESMGRDVCGISIRGVGGGGEGTAWIKMASSPPWPTTATTWDDPRVAVRMDGTLDAWYEVTVDD